MIEISGLEKTFDQPGGDKAAALRGVISRSPAGQFVSVIGSNGSGQVDDPERDRRDVPAGRREHSHRRART